MLKLPPALLMNEMRRNKCFIEIQMPVPKKIVFAIEFKACKLTIANLAAHLKFSL
jgi:hypothetical protein